MRGEKATRRRGPLGAHFVRNSILAGGVTVFAQKGVSQTSVEDLLVASGISRRTFYRFFKNKEEVLASLFDVACTLFVGAFEDAVAKEAGPAEKVARGVDTYLEFLRSSGPLMRVLFGESQRPDSPLYPRRRQVVGELAALLGREAEAFVGHPVDPLLLQGLVGGLESMATATLEHGGREDPERTRAAMQRLVAATLAGSGPLLPPLPRAPASRQAARPPSARPVPGPGPRRARSR